MAQKNGDTISVITRQEHNEIVDQLEEKGYFGVLETHFEAGRIVRLKKHETLVKKDLKNLSGK